MADTTYQPKAYRRQGGDAYVIAFGGTFLVELGGILADATGNLPASVTFAVAAGAANVCEVAVTVKDAAGAALAAPFLLDLWLSDAATGIGLTATTASGAVAAKAASGQDMAILTTKKALRIQTLGTGIYVLSITDTAKTGFFVAAQIPGTPRIAISAALVAGNYG